MDILFLCHRIPFPADKGDKIVTNNILRYFSARYRVHLATFIDDPADEKHRDVVGQMCASSWIGSISKATKVKRALLGLIRGEPLTASIYADEALKKWISETVKKHGIRHILVYSSGAARSLQSAIVDDPNNRLVVDFCDVDSHKWQQYARTHRPPMKWIYAREAKKLVAYDRALAMKSRAAIVCTKSEVAAFSELAPEVTDRLKVVHLGMDRNFFSVDASRASPFKADTLPIVFTGHMGYWPNIDAVQWFVSDVLPKIRQRVPAAQFWIVGTDPSPAVQALAKDDVFVTGRVPDVRPYLQHARLVVAPNRIGRGIANKALEAMSMAKPLIVSPQIAMGLEQANADEDYLVAANAAAMAELAVRVLMQPDVGDAIGANARARIEKDYDWDRNLSRTEASLLGTETP